MAQVNREYGAIGLGRMGGNLAHQALEKGLRVVGYVKEPSTKLLKAGMVEVRKFRDFKTHLLPPRAIFLYISSGPQVDETLGQIIPHLEVGDILVDGGNSYWIDSIRRCQKLKRQGIHFVDLGTSGGISGVRHGACFMAGGSREAVAQIEPILLELATPGGYVHAGPPGAGHFSKFVHNHVEFSMLQGITEGIDLLEHYKDKLDIASVLGCWRHSSAIRSRLIDFMESTYRAEGGIEKIRSYVEDTGAGEENASTLIKALEKQADITTGG